MEVSLKPSTSESELLIKENVFAVFFFLWQQKKKFNL